MFRNSDIENASKDTKLYERLKASTIDLSSFVNVSLQASVAHTGNGLTWELSEPIHSWNIVPTFSNTKFRQRLSPQTSADASADMSGDCLIPVVVGMSVRDKSGKEVDSYFADDKFDHGNKPLKNTFTGLSTDTDYTLYPKVRIFGFNLLASPSAELERQEFPVEITDFKQTGSEYKKDGFSHNGKTYSYQFDCTVTVTLKNSDNVEDWGWVYCDPDGQEAFISLKSFSSPYPDSRYVYLRNEAKSTATVYPYVKLRGEERQTGEPHDYPLEHKHKGYTTCPDDNYPHAIDLGLPSGTLWACCNVGASAPEAYGGYYDFGQVASAPTKDQILELLNYCSSEWTTQNGVNGRKFTGPNGGTIFLPAAGVRWVPVAGSRWGSGLLDAGSYGSFWSSTLYESSPYGAYGLYFYSNDANWYYDRRGYGQSVRPAR